MATLACMLLSSYAAHAVTGCSLNDPERDLRRFFPEMDAFDTQYLSFATQGPQRLRELQDRLQTPLDDIYETADVPYTLYTVWQGQRRIGHAFGANQRGRYSNIQVIALTDGGFRLKKVYLQKIRSPKRSAFTSEAFLDALASWPLADYPKLADCYAKGRCQLTPIPDPSRGEEAADFHAVLRTLSKLSLLPTLLFDVDNVIRAPQPRDALTQRVAEHRSTKPPRSADEIKPGAPRRTLVMLDKTGLMTRVDPLEFDNEGYTRVGDSLLLEVPGTGEILALRGPGSRTWLPAGKTLLGLPLALDPEGRLFTAVMPPQVESSQVGLAESGGVVLRLNHSLAERLFLASNAPQSSAELGGSRGTSMSQSPETTLVMSRGRVVASFTHAPGELDATKLQRASYADGEVLLLTWRNVRVAHLAPQERAFIAGIDPWTGEPLIATPKGQVWFGVSGRPLTISESVLHPLPTLTMGVDHSLTRLCARP